MNKLTEYPGLLFELEVEINAFNADIREAIRDRTRLETKINLETASLDKADYPNADARKAYAEDRKSGEEFMEVQRRIESLSDSKAQLEAEHRRLRREWKVAQIIEQKELARRRFWNDDVRPEEPDALPCDEPDDTPDESVAAFGAEAQNGAMLDPDDDLPF